MAMASRRGVKQVELSARFGVSRPQVSRVLSNQALVRQAINQAVLSGRFRNAGTLITGATPQIAYRLQALDSPVPPRVSGGHGAIEV